MEWTKVLPENDGYYWFRNRLHSAQIVVFFKKNRIVSFGNHYEFVSSCCKVDAEAEWAGPIPEPQIMPAPEPEQCPYKEGDLVLCRDHEEQKWQVHRFLRYVDYNITCKFMTTTSSPHNVTNYRYCLPLAGNEHLLDTKDNKEE